MPEFATLCEKLVKCQYQGLRSALVGTGEFRLTKSRVQFRTSKVQWMEMTAQRKDNLYRKFRSFVENSERVSKSSDGQSTVLKPRTNGKKIGQVKRSNNAKTTTLKKQKTC